MSYASSIFFNHMLTFLTRNLSAELLQMPTCQTTLSPYYLLQMVSGYGSRASHCHPLTTLQKLLDPTFPCASSLLIRLSEPLVAPQLKLARWLHCIPTYSQALQRSLTAVASMRTWLVLMYQLGLTPVSLLERGRPIVVCVSMGKEA